MHKIKSFIKFFLPKKIYIRLYEAKQYLYGKRISNYVEYKDYFTNKNGIEIGGPSELFKFTLPIYKCINALDNVNFKTQTLWENGLSEGLTYNFYKGRQGYQFICEATNLANIKDSSYDFVISSNCLEHIANPLKALLEWKRILSNNGVILLVLPNKKNNFDHRRNITTFEHIHLDYIQDTSESDLTHLSEILTLHDLTRDISAGDMQQFKRRSLENFNNRAIHHHVYDLDLLAKLLEFISFDCILKSENSKDYYILAKKVTESSLRN